MLALCKDQIHPLLFDLENLLIHIIMYNHIISDQQLSSYRQFSYQKIQK